MRTRPLRAIPAPSVFPAPGVAAGLQRALAGEDLHSVECRLPCPQCIGGNPAILHGRTAISRLARRGPALWTVHPRAPAPRA